MSETRGEWEAAVRAADLVLLGPSPPLRGGIAMHTRRLAVSARAAGLRVATASWSRLYPAVLFPGRAQRIPGSPDPWSREVLDTCGPRSWLALRRLLAGSRAKVVLQWWHPVTAPAHVAATLGIERDRILAICHNVLPHEPLPGAALAARLVLSRCHRVICHAGSQAALVRKVTAGATSAEVVPLPCLIDEAKLDAGRATAPASFDGFPAGARVLVAAGHVRAYKGIDVLLAAWRRARRPPEARLVIAGESYLRGQAHRAVQSAAQTDASIFLLDRYVEDEELVQILARAEAVVAAHRLASQSGILPIARALGRPVIASDAGALAAQAGPEASVVRAGDAAALAAAIEACFSEPPSNRAPTSAASRAEEWRNLVEAMVSTARP